MNWFSERRDDERPRLREMPTLFNDPGPEMGRRRFPCQRGMGYSQSIWNPLGSGEEEKRAGERTNSCLPTGCETALMGEDVTGPFCERATLSRTDLHHEAGLRFELSRG